LEIKSIQLFFLLEMGSIYVQKDWMRGRKTFLNSAWLLDLPSSPYNNNMYLKQKTKK